MTTKIIANNCLVPEYLDDIRMGILSGSLDYMQIIDPGYGKLNTLVSDIKQRYVDDVGMMNMQCTHGAVKRDGEMINNLVNKYKGKASFDQIMQEYSGCKRDLDNPVWKTAKSLKKKCIGDKLIPELRTGLPGRQFKSCKRVVKRLLFSDEFEGMNCMNTEIDKIYKETKDCTEVMVELKYGMSDKQARKACRNSDVQGIDVCQKVRDSSRLVASRTKSKTRIGVDGGETYGDGNTWGDNLEK